jgi:hypothetical protein
MCSNNNNNKKASTLQTQQECASAVFYVTEAQVILKPKDKFGFGLFTTPMMVTLFEVLL